jgi:hypothetical protein
MFGKLILAVVAVGAAVIVVNALPDLVRYFKIRSM